MSFTWIDKLYDSALSLGPLMIWIDEGAEGWRIHATITPFVIAKRGEERSVAKRAALAILADVAKATRAHDAPSDPGPPRPDDMAELARLVTRELRNRGLCVAAFQLCIIVPRLRGTLERGYGLSMHHYSLYGDQFDNLTPRECADVIQREEAAKAAEWAGDR